MKFIEQKFKIVSDYFTRENVLKQIEKAARTCYQSEGKMCEGSDIRLLNKLLELNHTAMIEHAPNLSISFTTCRGVTHELVRHRMASFAQESTRYVKYGKDGEDMEFIIPPWIIGNDREFCLKYSFKYSDDKTLYLVSDNIYYEIDDFVSPTTKTYIEALAIAEYNYGKLIESGWKPQQAREVLPNAIKSEIVVTANVREWRHIFQLRCDLPAHPMIRELMIPTFLTLKNEIPELWEGVNFSMLSA